MNWNSDYTLRLKAGGENGLRRACHVFSWTIRIAFSPLIVKLPSDLLDSEPL